MKKERISELIQLIALVLMLVYLGFEDEEWLLVLSAAMIAVSLVLTFASSARKSQGGNSSPEL